MQYGMNLLLWTSDLSDSIDSVLEQLKEMGYDGVEIPLFDLDVEKYARWAQRLDELELRRTAVTVRTEADNPISSDASVRAKGLEQNRRTLDCCQALGVETLVGPFHSALGAFTGKGPTEDEWKWGVEGIRQMAEYAQQCGVMLGVECLNRFECYFLNAQADLVRFVREVDHPHCRAMYDTFHANIEEKSVSQAVQTCAEVLCHVHISENDRSTPGSGGVRWSETFDALHAAGYDGWLVVEAFGLALPELAAATKIWRRMYESEEQLARDALAFMKSQVAQRW